MAISTKYANMFNEKHIKYIFICTSPHRMNIHIIIIYKIICFSFWSTHKNIYTNMHVYIYVHTLKPKEEYLKNNSWNKSSYRFDNYYIIIILRCRFQLNNPLHIYIYIKYIYLYFTLFFCWSIFRWTFTTCSCFDNTYCNSLTHITYSKTFLFTFLMRVLYTSNKYEPFYKRYIDSDVSLSHFPSLLVLMI